MGGSQRLSLGLSSLTSLLECTFCSFASFFGLFELESGLLVFGLECRNLCFSVFQLESHVLHLGAHLFQAIVCLLTGFAFILKCKFDFLHTFISFACLFQDICRFAGFSIEVRFQLHDALFKFADLGLHTTSALRACFKTSADLRASVSRSDSNSMMRCSSLRIWAFTPRPPPVSDSSSLTCKSATCLARTARDFS